MLKGLGCRDAWKPGEGEWVILGVALAMFGTVRGLALRNREAGIAVHPMARTRRWGVILRSSLLG